MGPKRSETATKLSRLANPHNSQLAATNLVTLLDQENQQCTGKFAVDFELSCREATPPYPIKIPVRIRGHPPLTSQVLSNTSNNPPAITLTQHTGASGVSSIMEALGDEMSSSLGRKTMRSRVPSAVPVSRMQFDTVPNELDKLSILTGQETSKTSSSPYKTFHVLDDTEFFRPKILVDLANNESESIDQIAALHMKAWRLDQRFIDILKKVVCLQETLHTLNFSYVGLDQHTFLGFVEMCQTIKNLKNVILDGNQMIAEYFYRLIERENIKIAQLSIRFCNINDDNSQRIANALGNMSIQNSKLLTLNLSGNQIGDNGAKYLATALRYNRTLISLNLSSNYITDSGAFHLAFVLRRIVLTRDEIIRRRFLLSERYPDVNFDEFQYNTSSPTPSVLSTKSKSNRDGRSEWKRFTDASKRKYMPSKIAQAFSDKRNRTESVEENRPQSISRGESRRGRPESGSGRSTVGNNTRRTPVNVANVNSKEPDQNRTPTSVRAKKLVHSISSSSKKNVTTVKEEDENVSNEEDAIVQSMSEETNSFKIQQTDNENPLLEMNDFEYHDGEIWLKGNFILLNLNLSRNYLTNNSTREFLLSIQQQATLLQFQNSIMSFVGLSRLELNGMPNLTKNSNEYQQLEKILAERNLVTRFQQAREREAKEAVDLASSLSSQQTIQTEKTRPISTLKPSNQRAVSRQQKIAE